MSQPSILTKDFWATQEDRLLELFALALAILEQKNLSDVVEEDAISRELYFCLREANRVLVEQGRGFDHLPIFDSKCQPDPNDGGRVPRESKRPDFQYELIDHQALPRESSIHYHIECKRLGFKSISNANYVHLGVCRFIDEEHGYGKSCRAGAMIGYVQGTDITDILAEVNSVCSAKNIAELTVPVNSVSTGRLHRLDHSLCRLFTISPFDLRHLWIDLRRHYS